MSEAWIDLLALTRDDARNLFVVLREDRLAEFLQQWEDQDQGNSRVIRFQQGQLLETLLEDPTTSAAAASQALQGYQLLFQQPGQRVTMNRPDLVPQIAAALHQWTSESLQEKYQAGDTAQASDDGNLLSWQTIWQEYQQLVGLYQQAADNGYCVVSVNVEKPAARFHQEPG